MPTITNNGIEGIPSSQHGRLSFLRQAGSFDDDDSLDELLDDVYTQRGRPEIDLEEVEIMPQEAEAHVYS